LPGERAIIAKEGEGIFTQDQMRHLAPVNRTSNTSTEHRTNNVNNTISVTVNQNGGRSESRATGNLSPQEAREFAIQVEEIATATFAKQQRFRGLGYVSQNGARS
jgi:hypothetical protein